MTAAVHEHPTDAELSAFGLGRADDTVVARHIETCSDCREKVSGAGGDSFVRRLAAAAGDDRTAVQSAEPPASVPPPSVVPVPHWLSELRGYRLDRLLGQGGMGEVYLSHNILLDRPEVLKTIQPGLLRGIPGHARERFRQEIRSAARLLHPNIVTTYSGFEAGEFLAMAMEYVPGQNLLAVVKDRGPLPVSHACHYVRQAALGLQHAHEKGMVHRDIKPDNLMLHKVGARHVVKILDFGLAKVASETPFDGGLTDRFQMMGTPLYMAPEQAGDAATANVQSDIYALGCTLFYLLTGRAPFPEKALLDIVLAHRDRPAPRLVDERPDIPAGLSALVAEMMEKNPAHRPPTPKAVADRLLPFFKTGIKAPTEQLVSPPPSDGGKSTAQAAAAETLPPARAPAHEPWWDDELPAAPDPGRGASGHKLAWMAVAVFTLFFAVVATVAAVVVKLQTKDGTIELPDLPADAVVTVNGEQMTVTRKGDVATIRITREGEQRLAILLDGKEVQANDVTVKLGGEPVRIRYTPRPLAALPAPSRLATVSAKGKWQVVGNVLAQDNPRVAGTHVTFGDAAWTDYDFQCQFHLPEEGQQLAILVRAKDHDNYYIFAIGGKTWASNSVESQADGKWKGFIHGQKTAGVAPGQWHDVHVSVRGTKSICRLDGAKCFEFDRPDHPAGGVGLRTWNTKVSFRDLKVTAPDGKVLWEGLPELPK